MKRICNILLYVSFTFYLYAVPAYRGAVQRILADGTIVTVFNHGDEYSHFLTLEDGTPIRITPNGLLDTIDIPYLESHPQQIVSKSRVKAIESPLNLASRGLIILANFKDVSFTTSYDFINRMHNGNHFTDNGATGSVKQYFQSQSFGQYIPQFDIYGPVTLPKDMAYYGSNGTTGNDSNPTQMVIDACNLAYEAYSIDFSKYDNNKDGIVDFVYIIYAGYGEADGGEENTIWPHRYWLPNGKLILGGQAIHDYACSSELSFVTQKPGAIGTFCHEFSHVLGLPDVYETTYCNSCTWKTSGKWDLMDYGCYNNNGKTPCAYTAYERFFLGWLQPTLLTSTLGISIEEIQKSNSALLLSPTGTHNLIGNDPYPTTFYMLENRQQVSWDRYLPGHGLMLTKIAYDFNHWDNNIVNNSVSNLGIDIIEADGYAPAYTTLNDDYYGKSGDLFPTGSTSYTGIENYLIQNITEKDSIISFQITYATDVENMWQDSEGTIQAIYTSMGIHIGQKTINQLPSGVYFVVYDNKKTKKIIKP